MELNIGIKVRWLLWFYAFYGFMVSKVSFVENVVATKYPENIFPIFLNRIWQRCKCFFLALQIYSSLFWKNAFRYHFKNGFTA